MSQNFYQGYAIVIGAGGNLSNTARDASAVAALLTDPTRCAYPPQQVQLLIGENATRKGILSSLNWLISSTDSEATVLVYFSGHGIIASDYYLSPTDCKDTEVVTTGISISELTNYLRAIRTPRLIVLLDVYQSSLKDRANEHKNLPSSLPLIDFSDKADGGISIISSRIDEVPLEGTPYSVFTNTLLEALSGYGSVIQDGYVRVLDMAILIGRKVPERTLDKQHPIFKIGNLSNNFPVALYAAGDKSPRSLPWTVSTRSHGVHVKDTQTTSWVRQLENYRQNLLLIEERMSEYIGFQDIPLQLINTKHQIENRITELEQKLGLSVLVKN